MPQDSQRLKVFIHGASGRMGKKVFELCLSQAETFEGVSWPRGGIWPVNGDVVVDFSLPEAFEVMLEYCVKNRLPLVSGTTGLTDSMKIKMREASKEIPILWSANMSFGVHVFLKMLKEFRHVAHWNFQLSEVHHIHKKDAPSGTALWLNRELEMAVHKKLPTPISTREGEVIGDHAVCGASPIEEITLTHRALDRSLFADGALRATRWLVSQPPGLYSLSDLLDNNP